MKKYTPQQYAHRMQRLTKEIEKGNNVVQKVSRYGAQVAAQLAPQDTGALINNIHFKKSKNNVAWILQKNPGHQNPNNVGMAWNYAEAMRRNNAMGVKWLAPRIRSGDPDYMKNAARFTRSKFKQNVRAHVVRAIKVTK